MSNIALTSIGAKVLYCVETVAGERPTSGYTHITGLKSTPDFNQAPSTGDGTTFENENYTTKVPLLRELPDTLEFNAIFGQEFADKWATLVSAFETAKASGLSVWFCIDIVGFDKSLYFTGEPIAMGLPAMDANAVIECPVFIIPTGEPIIAAELNTTEYKITVTVSGATTGDLVSGAKVEIIGYDSKLTDISGVAEFDKVNGTYDIKISKTGITTQYKEVVVEDADESVAVTGFNA